MGIKAISQQRFEALCFMRLGRAKLVSEEREWYSDDNENVLGVVIFDKPDEDWVYVILGRDEVSRFRAIDQEINFKTDVEARNALHKKMEEHIQGGDCVFPQGVEQKRQKAFEIFKPIAAENALHPSFKLLAESKGYSPAREIIEEIAYTFEDPDGNYLQQFQTTAFDARLWELYLYAVLHELGFELDRNYKAPDYYCFSFAGIVMIEATTANSTLPEGVSLADLKEKELESFIAITFGSALFSKLQKRYWEKEHVKGHPLVFAVADFRRVEDLGYCAPFLMQYLYGLRQHVKDGVFTYSLVEKHTYGGKTIPSGFFNQPDAENVSAILFSDSGTISKFNRMGKIGGFGDPSVKMIRVGERFSTSESEAPESFRSTVDESYQEAWAEGIWIFHNPNAKIPLERELFPDVAHVYSVDNEITVFLANAFPTWSKTIIVSTTD